MGKSLQGLPANQPTVEKMKMVRRLLLWMH